MSQPRPLSPDVLERLEERLRADGAQPIAGAGPGLTTDEISKLTAALPYRLPAEARLWWSWRSWGQGRILPGVQSAPLEDAMGEYAFRRQAAADLADSAGSALRPDDIWHPGWLPVFAIDSGRVIVIDSARSDANLAPIHLIDWQELGDTHFARVVSPSLGQYVSDTLDAIDAGGWVYHARFQDWRRANSQKTCRGDASTWK